LQKETQICVVGKVFRPNKSKILALNKTLGEYFKLMKLYFSCNSASKKFLYEKCYEDAKRLFNLNTALIQTARDKAVEILKSFEEKKKKAASKTCHRCGHVAQVNGREFGCINIAHALTRGMGWGSLAFEPADGGKGVKPPLTPEAPGFGRGVAHFCIPSKPYNIKNTFPGKLFLLRAAIYCQNFKRSPLPDLMRHPPSFSRNGQKDQPMARICSLSSRA